MSDADRLIAIGQACGLTLDARQVEKLLDFRDFLGSEAISAGGIGPNEADRLVDRHVGDSLAYLLGIGTALESVLDVGSGVGLPGIPMAIARPDLSFVLLDRSQGRSDLTRRAVRMLGLENVQIRTQDVTELVEPWGVMTFRASLALPDAALVVSRLLTPGGIGIFGVSRRVGIPKIVDPPEGVAFEVSCELDGILDSPFWLLRMTII